MFLVKFLFISEYRDYYIHYQKSVPEQMPSPFSLLPSVLSHNAKSTNILPTNIIERLDWLNSQQEEKSSSSNFGSIHALNRFASSEKTESPQIETQQIEVKFLNTFFRKYYTNKFLCSLIKFIDN